MSLLDLWRQSGWSVGRSRSLSCTPDLSEPDTDGRRGGEVERGIERERGGRREGEVERGREREREGGGGEVERGKEGERGREREREVERGREREREGEIEMCVHV